MILGATTAVLSLAEYDDLPAFEEPPTDVAIGMKWVQLSQAHGAGLRLGEYVRCPEPFMVGIVWRGIEVVG